MSFRSKRIFPWSFLLLGAGLLIWGLHTLWQAHWSTTWPTAPGHVISSKVVPKRNSKSTTYAGKVEYAFEVSGTPYTASRVAYGDYSSSSTAHAQSLVQKYPKGAAVTVHYNPASPEVAVLEPGIFLQAIFVPLGGLLFLFAGVVILIYFSRQTLV